MWRPRRPGLLLKSGRPAWPRWAPAVCRPTMMNISCPWQTGRKIMLWPRPLDACEAVLYTASRVSGCGSWPSVSANSSGAHWCSVMKTAPVCWRTVSASVTMLRVVTSWRNLSESVCWAGPPQRSHLAPVGGRARSAPIHRSGRPVPAGGPHRQTGAPRHDRDRPLARVLRRCPHLRRRGCGRRPPAHR